MSRKIQTLRAYYDNARKKNQIAYFDSRIFTVQNIDKTQFGSRVDDTDMHISMEHVQNA